MKKILFCDNSFRDLINFRGDVIYSYAADGYEVVLVAPHNADFQFPYSNVRYIPIEMHRSGMNPLKEWVYMNRLMKIFRVEKPDYVFTYTIKPNIYGSIAAALCRIPSTAMIAGLGYVFDNNGIGSRIARILYRYALQFPEHVLVLNSYNRDLVIEKRMARQEQVILLPGGEGLDLNKFKD